VSQAAAYHSPSGTVNAARTAQLPSATVAGAPIPARADDDLARVAGRGDRGPEPVGSARDSGDVARKSLLGIAMAADSLAAQQWSADPHVLETRLRELAGLARQALVMARSAGAQADAGIPEPEMVRQLHAVPSAPPARVVIADGNPVLRAGLRAVLDGAPTTTVVAEAADAEDAVQQVQRHDADVLLLDARMPLPDGLATLQRLGQLTEVVLLDWTDDSSSVTRAVLGGASGYAVNGQFEPGELISVVLDAARRDPGACRRVDPFPAGPFPARDASARPRQADLRPREREIMQYIAEGLSNRQIAARLVISEKTVKNHICSIYQRLGVPGRSQAISHWRDQ
jgi:DNA-binding NarL/FixJ family response regulator